MIEKPPANSSTYKIKDKLPQYPKLKGLSSHFDELLVVDKLIVNFQD